jgi:hypothetical protein
MTSTTDNMTEIIAELLSSPPLVGNRKVRPKVRPKPDNGMKANFNNMLTGIFGG